MNCFSHAAAYSLYPRGTFERRIMLTCDVRDHEDRGKMLEEKYKSRGWTVIRELQGIYQVSMTTQRHETKIDFFLGQRSVGDGTTWTIPFPDTAEILRVAFPNDPPPDNIICGRPIQALNREANNYVDPTSLNSFNFTFNRRLNAFEIRFDSIRTSTFVSPSWVVYKGEVCYTLSLQLSRKMGIWMQRLDSEDHKFLREYVSSYKRDKLLAEWIDKTISKCTCGPNGLAKRCSASITMLIGL